MAFNFIKNLNADDIFISYTRRDAAKYANGLRRELKKKGFSSYIDRLGAPPDADVPDVIKRKIRSCAMLVVVCTEWSGTRETIEKEIQEFLSAGQRSSIVPVDFGGAVYKARWYKLIEGIAPEPETNPLESGDPSPDVIDRIEEAFKYSRRNERLRRATFVTGAVLLTLILASIAAGAYAAWQLKAAQAATTAAEAARQQAADERAKAEGARQQAAAAQADADTATANANEQKRLADEAARKAAEQTKLADEATQRAQEAQARADQAQARAEHQGAIAESRSLANRSQTVLRQRPEEPSSSLLFAKEAMEKSVSTHTHLLEADTAVRDSLALFPRIRSSYTYAKGNSGEVDGLTFDDVRAVALSPDGRYFASVTKDNKLHVYVKTSEDDQTRAKESAVWQQLTEFPDCTCSQIALSSGGAYAAAVNQGGVVIIDLRTRKSDPLILEGEDRVKHPVERIALSPSGRYLALTADFEAVKGKKSTLWLVDLERKQVVRVFDEHVDTPGDRKTSATGQGAVAANAGAAAVQETASSSSCDSLNMLIHDVTFGPTGDLAVAGGDMSAQGVSFAGRIVLWKLRLDPESGKAERDLTDADFANREIVRQARPVMTIAPGTDGTYFATDTGVWKRPVGRVEFEPVTRFGYPLSVPLHSTISRVAFGAGGGSLTLIREIEGEQRDQSNDEVALETWDTNGYVDTARMFPTEDVESLGFKPGSEFLAVLPDKPSGRKPAHVYRVADGVQADVPSFEPEPADRKPRYVSANYIVYADEVTAVVWDVWSGRKATVKYGDEMKNLQAATVSPGGRFLALSGTDKKRRQPAVFVYRVDGDLRRWGKPITPSDDCNPDTMSLSADGRRLAGRCELPRVWDVTTGRDVSPKALDESAAILDEVSDMLLSPDGRLLVVTSLSDWPYVLDLSKAGAKLTALLEDTKAFQLAFSPDGRYLGLGSGDVLHVFDTRSPDGVIEIAQLDTAGSITAVAFSDDDRYVATASTISFEKEESYPVRVWLLRPEELLAEAKSRLDRLHNTGRWFPASGRTYR